MIAFLVIGIFQLAILGVVLVGFGYAASLLWENCIFCPKRRYP
jgi:hypothetical protein